jgi:hypothetical protein
MRYFLPIIFLFIANLLKSQVSTIYTFSETTGAYTSITGGTQLVTTTGGVTSYDTDGNYFTLAAGSQFTFNGTTITAVNMTSDGALWLNPITTTTGNGTTGAITSTGTAAGIICAMNMDLRSTSLASQVYERRWQDVGTEVVFQWQNAARYLQDGVERFSFQIRVTKSTGVVRVVYGNMTTIANSTTYVPQVGLRGTTNADFNNRRLTGSVPDATPNWGAPNGTTAGTSNAHTVRFTSNASCFPTSGLIFIWTPASCLPPTGLTITYTSPTSANLSWTASSSAPSSGYGWEIRTSGAGGSGATGLVTSGTTAAGVTTASTSALTANTTYILYVRSNCGGTYSTWAASGSSTSPAAAPSNDACSGATSLPCATSNLAGTTVGTVSESAPLSVSSNFGVWYSFTGDGQQTTISTTAGAGFDHELLIMSGTSCGSFTQIADEDADFAGGTETYTFTTVNGTQYYVYISYWSTAGLSTDVGTFTISRTCTTAPTPWNPCSSIPTITCGTSNNLTVASGTGAYDPVSTSCGYSTPGKEYIYQFTPTTTGNYTISQPTSFDYIDWFFKASSSGCNGTGWTCIDDIANGNIGNVNVSIPMTAGTTYYIMVDPEVSTGGSVVWTLNCPAPPPTTNDVCANATLISSLPYTSPVTSNSSATDDVPSSGSSCATQGSNLWYRVVGNGNQLTASTCNPSTNFDTELRVYTGSCSSLNSMVEVVCDDDDVTCASSGSHSTVSWCSQNAIDYYISVGYFASGAGYGNFVLSVSSGSSCSILPITLIEFKAENIDNYNLLNWKTESEINNDFFTIERSIDGFNWEVVTNVDGAGNSSTYQSYSYQDYKWSQDATNYYRLRQTDFDGSYKYSQIVSVRNKSRLTPKLIKIISLDGKEVDENYKGFTIEWYDDGTYKKRINF